MNFTLQVPQPKVLQTQYETSNVMISRTLHVHVPSLSHTQTP
jgi:hypothetical protein